MFHKKTCTHKQKATQTKKEKRKTKWTKEKKEKVKLLWTVFVKMENLTGYDDIVCEFVVSF